MSNDPDIFLIERLKNDDADALKSLFDQYFPLMMRQAYRLTQNKEVSEELTQDVLIYVWKARHKLNIQTTFKSYVMRAIKNRCYTYFKREYRTDQVELNDTLPTDSSPQADENLRHNDLSASIAIALSRLPDKTRSVFVMSREEEMSYQEIADQLEISIKTVEYHMGNALKLMREGLESFGYMILLGIFF